MLSILTGLLLGAWHVVSGPDHLAAVTPLVLAGHRKSRRGGSRRDFRRGLGAETKLYRAYYEFRRHRPRRKDQARRCEDFFDGLLGPEHQDGERSPSRIGLAWGIGHASGVWLVGLVLLAIGSLIPLELVGVWSERIVGVAIVAVGVWGLWRVRRAWGHEHEHPHHADHSHGASGSAVGIGLIHGVAGSSHLYGVLPALALAAGERVGYLIGFGIGSIVAMGLFAGLVGLVVGRVPGSRAAVRRWGLLVASLAAVVIGTAWVALA